MFDMIVNVIYKSRDIHLKRQMFEIVPTLDSQIDQNKTNFIVLGNNKSTFPRAR